MSTNEINIEAVNARAKEEQTPMTKIPSVEETEETAKAIIEKVRHYATPPQHPDNSAEAKAYLEGVNTAMAMLYIDLTGTPKVKGFLTTYAETQRLALLTELREYVNQIAYHDIDPNGNYEPSNCKWSTAREQANNTRKQL